MNRTKVIALDAAAELVEDGARLGIGGVLLRRKPIAFLTALADAGRRDLRLYSFLASLDVELLVSRGAVAEVHAGYVGFEQLGFAPAYGAAVAAGRVAAFEYSELVFVTGLRASAAGLPFLPTRGAKGSDLVAELGLRDVECPYTGERILAAPAIRPEVCVLHAEAADALGNVLGTDGARLPLRRGSDAGPRVGTRHRDRRADRADGRAARQRPAPRLRGGRSGRGAARRVADGAAGQLRRRSRGGARVHRAGAPMTVSPDEQIAWCLARRCRPADVVVVGVATPIAAAAAQLARELLVPDAVLIEAAAVDVAPHDVADSLVRPERVAAEAVGVLTQLEILDAIQRGRVSLQFVSPAQVDGRGALNTSRVRAEDGRLRRLPGGLATADVSQLVGRLVAYRAAHTPRFLPREVDFVTGAPGRVEAVVTDRAVLEWSGDGFRLASVHEGATVDEAVAGCGFPLTVDGDVAVTEPPPPEALELLRGRIDPHGLRRLETRAGRADALRELETLR